MATGCARCRKVPRRRSTSTSPICDRLCWFCACHTKQTRQYDPLARYLTALSAEIDTVAALAAGRLKVTALHFGGGSPTMLKPEHILSLGQKLREKFAFAADAEISVEMDPNDMDAARFDALAAIGMTRASLGVQDFDARVQQAINREQTFEQTKAVVDAVRARGVHLASISTCSMACRTRRSKPSRRRPKRCCRCGPTASRCSATPMCRG